MKFLLIIALLLLAPAQTYAIVENMTCRTSNIYTLFKDKKIAKVYAYLSQCSGTFIKKASTYNLAEHHPHLIEVSSKHFSQIALLALKTSIEISAVHELEINFQFDPTKQETLRRFRSTYDLIVPLSVNFK